MTFQKLFSISGMILESMFLNGPSYGTLAKEINVFYTRRMERVIIGMIML